MKILELCFSKSWGGLEIYVSTFAKEFNKFGYEIYGVTIPDSKLNFEFSQLDIKNIKINPFSKYLDIISAYKIKKTNWNSIRYYTFSSIWGFKHSGFIKKTVSLFKNCLFSTDGFQI